MSAPTRGAMREFPRLRAGTFIEAPKLKSKKDSATQISPLSGGDFRWNLLLNPGAQCGLHCPVLETVMVSRPGQFPFKISTRKSRDTLR